jgi:hypothetical protein
MAALPLDAAVKRVALHRLSASFANQAANFLDA